MRTRQLTALSIVMVATLPAVALACMWDSDTLQMERNRFPSALELIAGKFLRHSREFYEWRVTDRVEKLKYQPENLGYYDDLAVAYSKLGHQDKAIETILAKDKKKPGLYETEANHATFLMLAGRWEEGLGHVEGALRINPDAHFGREKYQKYLAEYVLTRQWKGEVPSPLAPPFRSVTGNDYVSFRRFLAYENVVPGEEYKRLANQKGDRKAAVQAVLGMMRFASHDSPLLLEALGDLLLNDRLRNGGDTTDDEKHLAARAYLKASYAARDAAAREAYRRKADFAREMQLKYRNNMEELTLPELEATFKREVAEADAWFAGVRENEMLWIREGKDADREFNLYYLNEPAVQGDPNEVLPSAPFFERMYVRIVGVVGLVGVVVLVDRHYRSTG